MFDPKALLGRPGAILLDALQRVDPHEPIAPAGSVELYSRLAEHESVTGRSATMLMETVTDAALPADHPHVRLDGLDLEEYLGGGGQGWVYLARVKATDKIVAVKVLRNESLRNGRSALREAELASRVHHPNILRVFEAKQVNGFAVIVMELIHGEQINAGDLPKSRLRECFGRLADALCALADARIVHCDIKPANILLRRHDRSPVIIDFGVAQDVSVLRPQTTISGTPYFMAPEVFREGIPHPAWDAYSLGVTASMLVIGKQKGATSLNGVQSEKLSGKFDQRLRLKLCEVEEDRDFAQWIVRLIHDAPEARLMALYDARQW